MENLLDNTFDFLPIDSKDKLIYLLNNNPKFYNWFLSNNIKIVNKFKGLIQAEDINDIVGELVCASTLLRSDKVSDLIYEPLGTQMRAPDFKVCLIDGQELYCEVRRIRRNTTEVSRDNFVEVFSSKIRHIQLNFGIYLYYNDLKIPGLSEKQIYDNLISEIDLIAEYIEEKLTLLKDECEGTNIILDSFAKGLYICAHSIPIKSRIGRVKFYGALYNCPFTQKEFTKFGDIIFEKLPQLVNDNPNLIFIITDNDSHYFEDLEDSISSIEDLLNCRNNNFFIGKGYEDINDFTNQYSKLGGIFTLTRSLRGNIWINRCANISFSKEIAEYLSECK